jgi:hypothetical protein
MIRRSYRGTALAAFLVSLGVLVIEISLTRLLSFTLWYHFTYVAISVALLGYGTSGSLLASWDRLARVAPATLITRAAITGAASVSIALLVVRFVPFQPLKITIEPIQTFLMAVYLLAITMPFFCAGVVISTALRHWSEHATVIYFADLVGGGLGCALAIPAIWLFGAPGGLAAGAVLLAAAGLVMAPRQRAALTAGVAAAAVAAAISTTVVIDYLPSADKFMGALMRGGMKPLFSQWSPIFRVDVYEGGRPRRLGTSPNFDGPIPAVRFISHDGTAEAAMYEFSGDRDDLAFFDWNVSAAPYQVLDRPSVMIIGLGGGFDVLAAIRGRARKITGVELDPVTIDLVKNRFGDFVGGILDRPEVETVMAEGRSFLRHGSDSYDLIQLTGVDTLAALSTGAYVLAESYLYTVEAMRDYIARLSDDGMVSFMIGDLAWQQERARFSLRHVQNFVRAAEEMGWSDPAAHAVVIGSRGGISMMELLFKKTPFTPRQMASLRTFARSRGFQILALPGQRTGTILEALLNATSEERRAIVSSYPLDVRETRDDRPFFFHFFRWGDLFDVSSREMADRGHTGAIGQIVLVSLLAFTVIASIALIFIPLLVSNRIALGERGSLRFAVYFGAVGLGFMLVEISLIQRFVLFLGHPTYAIATILAALLTSTGLGSFLSGKAPVAPARLLIPALIAVSAIAILYSSVLPPLFDALLGAPRAVRVVLALVLLLPLGLCLGVFFPTGLRIVNEQNPDFIPWAWGVNGGASVVGTILAIVLGITFGFPAVTSGGLALYALGTLAMVSTRASSITQRESTACP